MAVRLSLPVRMLLMGALPALALVALQRGGAISDEAYQAVLTVLYIAGGLLVLARGVVRPASRRGWRTLGVAITAGMTGNALTGWDTLGLQVPIVVRVVLGATAFGLAAIGLAFMLSDRPTRLPLGAALDGMTGVLVVQALIAIALFTGVPEGGFDLVLYPLADVLLMGLVAAGVAQGGWRLDSWAVSLAGLVAMTIGDSAALATSIAGQHVHAGAADLGWLAGVWLLAVGAWSPDPREATGRWVRSAVPVVLGSAALGILTVVTFSPDPLLPALACAAAALAVVVARLAITLRDNDRMLHVARTESSTDALTGLGNRRQLMVDLDAELARAARDAPAALALFDLNGFKDYNDTYGHPAGDALLASLGGDLAAAVEGIGTAYRMGGDEFCVLVHTGATGHEAIAERAAAALSAATRTFTVTAARGLVLLPTDAAVASDALRLADVRMYDDKSGSRLGSRRQVTQALMLAVEERDGALHGHGTGVEGLAGCVARRLGLGETEVDTVRLAALLHDVGKLAIPDRILDKPGPLDDREWRFMRRHTLIGQRILEGAPALRDVALLVRSSHERYDGGGYPDALRGDDIPLGARIIAVCDAFDAMRTDRPYGTALPADAALAELRRCAGSQFDPEVVRAFEDALAAYAATHAGRLAA